VLGVGYLVNKTKIVVVGAEKMKFESLGCCEMSQKFKGR
jgi:hypothetical protein